MESQILYLRCLLRDSLSPFDFTEEVLSGKQDLPDPLVGTCRTQCVHRIKTSNLH